MSTFVGRVKKPKTQQKPVPEPKPAETRQEPTRAELIEEAEDLGIKVPPKANKAQIQKLIDEASVI